MIDLIENFKNQNKQLILTRLTVTADAALFAIEAEMGEDSTSPILLKATRAF